MRAIVFNPSILTTPWYARNGVFLHPDKVLLLNKLATKAGVTLVYPCAVDMGLTLYLLGLRAYSFGAKGTIKEAIEEFQARRGEGLRGVILHTKEDNVEGISGFSAVLVDRRGLTSGRCAATLHALKEMK